MTSAHFERWTRLPSVPRVRIEYKSPQHDDVELPFVVGVLAPLSGHASGELPLAERRFREIDADGFDAHLRALKPRLAFTVQNALDDSASELALDLSFESLDDFSPAALARQVPPLARLLELREGATREVTAELDRRWTAQLNTILHHPALKQLEASWRGLHFLVTNTADDPLLELRVLDVTKRELHRALKQYKGVAWQHSLWFKRVHEDEYGSLGGRPYGCLIGDFEFDHGPADTEMLAEIAKTCAAAHVPFIGGAAPSLFMVDSWSDLAAKRDPGAIFATAGHAAFRALREADDARYLGLTLPRFLARLPYAAHSNPSDELDFEEDTGGGHPDNFCWANAVYAFGVVVTRAFAEFGWCSRIRGVQSGGLVPTPASLQLDADELDAGVRCPLEVSFVQESEAAFSSCGLIPLLSMRGSSAGVFYGAASLHAPARYEDPVVTENARLAAQLPYLFAVCRFAHYLKVIMRDRLVGSYRSIEDTQSLLQQWIMQYVHGAPEQASEAEKAERPLAAAAIELTESPDDPSYLLARFSLQPHYQLEGLTTTLRLRDRVRSPIH